MQRGKEQAHDQRDNPEADLPPCCVAILPAPPTHAQLVAWRHLWRLLLMETVDDNESPARKDEGEHHDQK
jgi:hypothetical protein